MKKLLVFSLSALVLTACTPKAYTDDLNAGKSAFQKGNYQEAVTDFKNALNDKKTDEAASDLKLSQAMQESLKLYQAGNFYAALQSAKKAVKEQAGTSLPGKSQELLDKINQAKTLSDSMKAKIALGKTYLYDNQYDKAAEAFKEVSGTTSFQEVAPIKKMSAQAAKLAADTAEMEKSAGTTQTVQSNNPVTAQAAAPKQNSAPDKSTAQTPTAGQNAAGNQATTSNQNTASNQTTSSNQTAPSNQTQTAGTSPTQQQQSAALSHQEAENLVKQHLNIQPSQNVFVKYDHDAANGDYIIHVYEFVVDNPQTGDGHTNTVGWYGVNKTTRAVYDAMK